MKLEVVEFYPNDTVIVTRAGTKILGTMHLFIDDFSLDLRGILCCRNKQGQYKCFLPSRLACNDEGEEIRMPFISFTDQKLNKEILAFCRNDLKARFTETKV